MTWKDVEIDPYMKKMRCGTNIKGHETKQDLT